MATDLVAKLYHPYAGLDEALYHDVASRVASGDLWLGPEVYFYSPLYAYLLGSLYACFGTHHVVARMTNVVLGIGTIGCLFYAVRWWFASQRVATLTALGAAVYGPAVVFDTSRMKVSLGQFLLACAFWMMAVAVASAAESVVALSPAPWQWSGVPRGVDGALPDVATAPAFGAALSVLWDFCRRLGADLCHHRCSRQIKRPNF